MSQGFQFDERLSALDQIMLRAESNPKTRNWVLSLVILESKPDVSRLLEQFERASREFVRLRQRVATPATPLGYARWEADPTFRLEHHFQHIAMPRGSDFNDLLDMACRFINKPGDLDRPLWEALLIDNVKHPAGKTAFMMRMHHAVADGMGAVQLFLSLFDTSADAPPRPFADLPEMNTRSWWQKATADVQDSIPDALKLGQTALHKALRHLKSPISQWRDDIEMASSIQRLYGSKSTAGSPLLAERSLDRQFLAWDFPFPPFKQALKTLGWSVNDGYLTALTIGLKRYHEALHCPIDAIPITIPVNVRHGGESEQTAGNHIAPVKLNLPTTCDTPHDMAKAIRASVRASLAEPALGVMNWLAPVIKGAPQFVLDKIADSLAEVDIQASNVPGYPFAPYLAGAKIARSYPFAPLPGVAIMAALYTQNDVAQMGIQLDRASVEDPVRLQKCIQEGFAEIEALASEQA